MPPQTPAQWLSAAQVIFVDVVAMLKGYGVAPDPALRLVPGDSPSPYYDPATKCIGLALPDAVTIEGRLYWLFAARALGLSTKEEAMAAVFDELPWLIAHEITHHLRHHFHAPNDSNFIEEQVANTVALAFVREHASYRRTLPRLRAIAARAVAKLESLSSDTLPRLAGFRMEIADVLASDGSVSSERLAELQLMARLVGEPLDVILDETGVVSDLQLRQARARRSETESYFNRRYNTDLFEYIFFHHEWLHAHLARTILPSLGEALQTYILTEDWERTRRQEAILLLTTTIRHPDDALAIAAADLLAQEIGDAAAPWLLAGLSEHSPKRQASLLGVISRLLDCTAIAIVEAAGDFLHASDPRVQAAAATLLARGSAGEGRRARALLRSMLAAESPKVREAALAAAGACDDAALAALAVQNLRQPLSAQAFRLLAHAPRRPRVAALALAALVDANDDVRCAALFCLGRHTVRNALPLLARCLDDPASTVRKEAAAAICAQGAAAIPILKRVKGGRRVRAEAALLLYALGDPHANTRIEHLVRELGQMADWLRAQCLALAVASEIHGIALLSDAADEECRDLIHLALRLAGRLHNLKAMDHALQTLGSPHSALHAAARQMARGASPIELRPVVEQLLDMLQTPIRIGHPSDGLSAVHEISSHLSSMDTTRPDLAPEQIGKRLSEHRAPASRKEGAIATARAISSYSDALLGDLAQDWLVAIEQESSPRGPRREEAMLTVIEKLLYMRGTSLLRSVPVADLRRLADEVIVRHYAAQEVIFRTGDDGELLYIISSGSVAIEQDTQLGSVVRVAELGPGSHFGEIALFNDEPRPATALAIIATTTLTLARESFRRLGARHPQILFEVIGALGERLREANVKSGNRIDSNQHTGQRL